MKIIATPVKAKDLKAGDLFSSLPAIAWKNLHPLTIGHKVYIRTDAPCPNDERNLNFVKITTEEDKKEEVTEDADNN